MRNALKSILIFSLLLPPAILLGQRGLPTPASVFGFEPGADYKLATYDQSVDYFRKLAASTKYMQLVEAGKTSEGRPMIFALVSTPENLSRVDRYREIARRLAHPRGLSRGGGAAAGARRQGIRAHGRRAAFHRSGRPATDAAARLRSGQQNGRADDQGILENVIVMLWPTINPDGQQIVAEWYMKNVGTPYELSGLPRLYQDYVGHDNNRDAYMLNMIESRVIEHTWRIWEPQIIYVQHQSGPFPTRIWLPPFSEPVGTDAPYLMSREVNMIGMAIAKGLEEKGQVGATHMGTAFDAWYPGYVDYTPNFKNIAAFWTETALFQYATPQTYTLDDFPENMRDLRPRSLYSSPWPPGLWRLRDAVDYMETASMSVLEFAAKYKESLLLDRYKAGVDQIALGSKKAPFAYFVPREQRDPVAAVELLRRLAFGGIRVAELTDRRLPSAVKRSRPARGSCRQIRNLRRSRAKCSTCRSIPTSVSIRAARRSDPTTPPAGRCRSPWASASSPATTPLGDDVRAKMKMIGPAPEPKVKPTPYDPSPRDAAAFDSVPGAGFDTEPGAAGDPAASGKD